MLRQSQHASSASDAESLTREARYRIGAEAHSEELTGSWSGDDKQDGADSPTAVVTIHDESAGDYFVWGRPSLFPFVE